MVWQVFVSLPQPKKSNFFLGFNLFCYIKPQRSINSENINFNNIFSSIFTLCRVATAEQWFLLLADSKRMMQNNFVCQTVHTYDDYAKYGRNGCGTYWAYLFFISFYVIMLLVVNLLVGIIINLSGTIRKQENSSINIYRLSDIKKLWMEFDPTGTGYMNFKHFWVFTSRIALLLGVGIAEFLDLEAKKKFLKLLDLPLYEDTRNGNIFCLNFHEVLISLSKVAVMIKFEIVK